mmetsp:Transcript_13856/g.19246  ORF Transcript_13856/g.19246 Transcript_13856/m.19246 type:complete len:333 (+) Transcript_13856:1480-2478(+)
MDNNNNSTGTPIFSCLKNHGNIIVYIVGVPGKTFQLEKRFQVVFVSYDEFKKWKQETDEINNSYILSWWKSPKRVDVIIFCNPGEQIKLNIPSFSLINDVKSKCQSLYFENDDISDRIASIIVLIQNMEKGLLECLASIISELIDNGKPLHENSLALIQFYSKHTYELNQVSELEKTLRNCYYAIDVLKHCFGRVVLDLKEFHLVLKTSKEVSAIETIQHMKDELFRVSEEINRVRGHFAILNTYQEKLSEWDSTSKKTLELSISTLSVLEVRWYLLAFAFGVVIDTAGMYKKIKSQDLSDKLFDTIQALNKKCEAEVVQFSQAMLSVLQVS